MTPDEDPQTHFEAVYTWAGPPRLELQRGPATSSGGEPYMSHRLIVQNGRPGAVVFGHYDGSVVLVRSRRPAAGAVLWELPRGFGEASDVTAAEGDSGLPRESMVAAGIRELREETGLSAVEARLLGEYVLDSSLYPTRVGVIWAHLDTCSAAATDGEVEDQKWVPLPDLPSLVAAGEISDGHSLAALAILWSHNRGAGPELPNAG